eukprot:499605-Rhodomonas_salina.1
MTEVKGKLVAVMRGPRPPAPAVPYGIKLFHAQNVRRRPALWTCVAWSSFSPASVFLSVCAFGLHLVSGICLCHACFAVARSRCVS